MLFGRSIGRQLVPALCVFLIVGCGHSPESYVDRGNRFAETGKFRDAAIQYEKAIQKAPAFADAHYRLGLLELKMNQPVFAYRELQRTLELTPVNEDALAKVGDLALRFYNEDPKHPRQLYEEASKAADRLLGRSPDGFDGNFLKGAIASTDRKPADAVLFLRKAVQAKPDDSEAQLDLARALVQNNQSASGISTAQEITLKNKAFGPAYDFLYRQFELSGRKDEAESILKVKVANNPKQAEFILQLARHYAALQKPAEVSAAIERLTSNPAAFPDGRMLAGDFYKSESRTDLALQQYTLGSESASAKKNLYRKYIVEILAPQRKWPEVFRQIEAILKDQPADEDAKRMRAFAWLDEGKQENLDPAIAELKAQSKKYPNDPILHFRIANGLGRKGDLDGVRSQLAAAAQVSRTYLPARYALVRLYLVQGKAADALRVSNEIRALDSRDPQAALLHAICLTAAGQYPAARAELNRLASELPRWPQVRFRLALLDMAEHKYHDAEDAFRKIGGDAAQDPEVLAGMAEAFEGENQGAKSIQLLRDELQRNPNLTALRGVLARISTIAGKYDIAIDQYKQLAAATPRSIDFQILLAGAYSAKGDAAGAEAVLEKAVQTDPKSVLASLLLARALLAMGRVDAAKTQYHLSLQLQPNNASALNDLAYLMADSGENLDQALSYTLRGLQYAGHEPSLRASLSDTLGWIYVKKNLYDRAVETFQPLVRNHPGNASFRYHLGTALYHKGDKQDARLQLEAALAAKPVPMDAQKIRELLARL